ncbi:rRNA methyltransferase [Phycicoccus sp. BSK3Z-2]|uniref:rRNA methyltransferase n=1 Tax=Phycicoccus avicenniae TaxID=2828860 RepID=A0A941DCT0_9MICO|nr:rRNA methyltransferase [Phycicoccus avicenniae]
MLAGVPTGDLHRATGSLIEAYRSGAPPADLVLRDPVRAAAYAGYRMPATAAAVGRVLREARRLVPDLPVATLTDVGGGTGAAAWAAAETLPDLRDVEVVDASADALALGARIAAHGPPPLTGARWTRRALGVGSGVPAADLITVSYLLGELPDPTRHAVVDAAVGAARSVVAVVEPGTPRGFAAVVEARDRLLGAGWHVLAPCPHEDVCPLAAAGDWCHLAVRLDRTALHRRLKDAVRGHEDEKVSYVVATREPLGRARGRVLRHPVTRKGLVRLEVCRDDGDAAPEVVTKRDRERYRAARDVAWGDPWTPSG